MKMAQDGLEPEEGYYRPDFKVYALRELNWSRVDIPGEPGEDISWVFWSRQDDSPERLLLYHDNFVGSKSDACPSPEIIREKIRLALDKMISDPCLDYALVQFWAPTETSEGRTLLTTQYQPFALGMIRDRDARQRLCEYRM